MFGDIYNSLHREVLDSDKQMLSKQNKLLVLNNNASNYKERIEKFDAEKQSKIKSLNESISKLTDMQSKLKDSVVAVNAEEVEKHNNDMNALNEKLDNINATMSESTVANNKLDVAIHKLMTARAQKSKVIAKHKEVLDKLCNDCKKVFSDYYSLDSYAKDIADIDLKIAKLQAAKESNSQTAAKLKS